MQLLDTSRPSDLDPLAGPLVVAAQHRPAGAVRLDQRQLQLGAHDLVLRLRRVDGREQLPGGLEALVVLGREVEVDRVRSELDLCLLLVDLLEVDRCNDGRGGLVEVVSVEASVRSIPYLLIAFQT